MRRTELSETSSCGGEEGLDGARDVFVQWFVRHRRPGRCRCASRGCRHGEGKLVQSLNQTTPRKRGEDGSGQDGASKELRGLKPRHAAPRPTPSLKRGRWEDRERSKFRREDDEQGYDRCSRLYLNEKGYSFSHFCIQRF